MLDTRQLAASLRGQEGMTGDFLQRMDADRHARAYVKQINEIRKHPNFHPRMIGMDPVSSDSPKKPGPTVVSHAARNTGFETGRPHRWGPLGGW